MLATGRADADRESSGLESDDAVASDVEINAPHATATTDAAIKQTRNTAPPFSSAFCRGDSVRESETFLYRS
jgi:hypothetical protein